MKFPQIINSINELKPYFIGFIFYLYSQRFIGILFPIKTQIKQISVLVKNSIEYILKILQKYTIDFVQLHGDERIEFCERLYRNNISFIKVFRINEFFIFSSIDNYINYSVFFLFDTYCLEYGGSGKKFSWKKIYEYVFDTPFFMSGGIGSKDFKSIKKILHKKILGVDINSKFEIEPVNKNRDEIKRFIHKMLL